MTTPILLAAIGGLVNRIGGLVNIGLESMMLAGALVAVEVSAATGSALLARRGSGAHRRADRPCDVAGGHAAASQRDHRRPRLQRRGRRPRALPAEERSMASRARIIRPASRCCRGWISPFSPAFPCWAPSFRGQDALTWFAWAMVPAIAFFADADALGAAAARDGRGGGDGARSRSCAADHPRRFDGLRRRHGGPRRRLSVDRHRRPVQRGHHRRARLHRAGRFLFRPQRRPGARRSGLCCSGFSMRRRSGFRGVACPPSSYRRCPMSSSSWC